MKQNKTVSNMTTLYPGCRMTFVRCYEITRVVLMVV